MYPTGDGWLPSLLARLLSAVSNHTLSIHNATNTSRRSRRMDAVITSFRSHSPSPSPSPRFSSNATCSPEEFVQVYPLFLPIPFNDHLLSVCVAVKSTRHSSPSPSEENKGRSEALLPGLSTAVNPGLLFVFFIFFCCFPWEVGVSKWIFPIIPRSALVR